MVTQYEFIHYTDWRVLCILDACRYDVFKKVNRIKGKLRKVRSLAPHTYNWLIRTFPNKYDWIYFSAHMWVGDKIRRNKPWNAIQHFKKVIPLWKDGFDESIGTVHPTYVCKTVKKYFEDNPIEEDCRYIIHFVQPHGPWIGVPGWNVPWTKELHERFGVMADYVAQEKKPKPSFMRTIYKANLKLVLRTLTKYLEYFPKPVVITADHGEMLGEQGLYLHKENFPKFADDLLREVPWLIVEDKTRPSG